MYKVLPPEANANTATTENISIALLLLSQKLKYMSLIRKKELHALSRHEGCEDFHFTLLVKNELCLIAAIKCNIRKMNIVMTNLCMFFKNLLTLYVLYIV